MAAPLELSCWGGGWGLPSVHSESLVVMAYAKFSGAPLKVKVIDNTWRGSRGDVPILTTEDNIISQPAKILNFLRKQKYNADYELSAKQGADTLAYIALIEEKLLPAVLHTFWVESDNYFSVTRPWFASRIPFPLSLILPGRMSKGALNRILLTRGEPPLYHLREVEAQIYRDAKECLNLLSNRLGTSQFFFGDTPSTLDAYVFGFLAPLYKVRFPKGQLQGHLQRLSNLCRFCDDILHSYFRLSLGGISPAGQETVDANLQKLTQLVNKESNLIEKEHLEKIRESFALYMLKTLEKSTFKVGNQMLYAVGLVSLAVAAFQSPEVELTESSTPGSEPCTLFVALLLKDG
ncbi:metaxin-3 isoform X1 [Zalophus californianus]|uniref:Metaxin n=1 Tax=Zalophus californianus TaxID=9704 RepID=A0A6J2E6Q3_ZALCA|nr:metaxin-3 isoform X1 [Zalophus californianus]